MSVVIGWDIGGAHLKAARVKNGRVEAVVQAATPLWLGTRQPAKPRSTPSALSWAAPIVT